ncbi:MAG: LPS export ABC transporter periplasmic protein LptC [Pseudomonadota bacterium]
MTRKLTFFWRRPGWTIAVAALSLGAWWWIGGAPRGVATTSSSASRIDYYMENFTAQFIQPDGSAPYLLRATFTAHDNVADVTVLQQPDLAIQVPGLARWRVTAGGGVITADEEIHLHEGVNTVREAIADLSPLQAYTKEMTIDAQQGVAHSTDLVTVFTDQATVDAKGMRVFFNEQRLQLLHNVRARYAP